jgi:hypothetical protein
MSAYWSNRAASRGSLLTRDFERFTTEGAPVMPLDLVVTSDHRSSP